MRFQHASTLLLAVRGKIMIGVCEETKMGFFSEDTFLQML